MMQRSPSGTGADRRRRAERRGHWGEFVAALCVRLSFYRILARRVRTPVGEIDLVVERGRVVAFVEVKTRGRDANEETTLGAVNSRRITRAAAWYLARNPRLADRDLRFDVILVAPLSLPRHVKGAFETE